jgi:glutathione S-transferase
MRYIELYHSTPLAEELLSYKGLPFKIKGGTCPAFPDTDGPVIYHEDKWIAGTYPILGYLDRRFVWPAYFPADHDEYAKASMVFDLFLRERPDPKDWLPLVSSNHFVLGRNPCIIDAVLASIPYDNQVWRSFADRVRTAQSPQLTDNAA